jgi:hypothetical protein
MGIYSLYQNETKVLLACAARPPAINHRENPLILLNAFRQVGFRHQILDFA